MKRRFPYILALVVVLGVAVAAFALTQSFFAPEPIAAEEGEPQPQMIIAIEEVENGVVTSGEVHVSFVYPEEVPTGPTAASGLFLAANGAEFTLGTGNIEVEASIEVINGEEPVETINAVHDGDDIPVRYTADTLFFLDISERVKPTAADLEAGEMVVERTLVPGSAADIGDNMMVRVWGTVNGDIVEADVVVYSPIR